MKNALENMRIFGPDAICRPCRNDETKRNGTGKIMDARKYTYRVVWSEEDGEFAGLCAEFPSLSWLAPSQAQALSGIVDLVKSVLADMAEQEEDIPVPLSLRPFSGRFVVRTTPEIHRRLAIRAAESGVSLNRYINSLF